MDYGYGGMLMWIVLILIIDGITHFIIREQRSSGRGNGNTPLEILKTRYAQGEILERGLEK
jgi:uncharacterized membrane protein